MIKAPPPSSLFISLNIGLLLQQSSSRNPTSMLLLPPLPAASSLPHAHAYQPRLPSSLLLAIPTYKTLSILPFILPSSNPLLSLSFISPIIAPTPSYSPPRVFVSPTAPHSLLPLRPAPMLPLVKQRRCPAPKAGPLARAQQQPLAEPSAAAPSLLPNSTSPLAATTDAASLLLHTHTSTAQQQRPTSLPSHSNSSSPMLLL